MDVIAAIRDILLSLYLLAGILLMLGMLVFAFLLYKAMKGLINVATRTVRNFEQVSEAAKEHIVKPLEDGISLGSVAGNAAGFATGFIAGMRGKKAQKSDEEADNGPVAKAKRWIPFL